MIEILTFDSNILAQVFYQDQGIVKLIGDVICPKKKYRTEKCPYLTSFKEINKITYDCKECKACSHLLNILLRHQKPCVTLFGWTYCFRKKTNLDYQKENFSSLMRTYIRPSKLSTTKAEEAYKDPVPKNAKIILYMEYSFHTFLTDVFLQNKFTFLFIFKFFSN